jgi:hypothetical protein
LSAEESSMIQPQILSAFRTRLVGHIHDDGQAAVLSQDEHLDARWIEKGVQFCVPYGDQWLPFWICDPLDKRENRSAGTVDKESPGQTDPADGDALGALRSWNERLNTIAFSELNGLENLEEKQIFQENRVTRDDPVHDKPVPANGNEPENPNGKPNRPAFSAGHRERSSHPLSPFPSMVNRSAVFPRTEQSLHVERFPQPSALTNREVDLDGSSRQLDDDQSHRSARTKFSVDNERSTNDLIDYSNHSKIKADASLEPGQDTDLEHGDTTGQDGLLSYEQISNDDQIDSLEDEFEYEYVDEDDPLVDPLDDLIDDDQKF